jgi:hypothetical protein
MTQQEARLTGYHERIFNSLQSQLVEIQQRIARYHSRIIESINSNLVPIAARVSQLMQDYQPLTPAVQEIVTNDRRAEYGAASEESVTRTERPLQLSELGQSNGSSKQDLSVRNWTTTFTTERSGNSYEQIRDHNVRIGEQLAESRLLLELADPLQCRDASSAAREEIRIVTPVARGKEAPCCCCDVGIEMSQEGQRDLVIFMQGAGYPIEQLPDDWELYPWLKKKIELVDGPLQRDETISAESEEIEEQEST